MNLILYLHTSLVNIVSSTKNGSLLNLIGIGIYKSNSFGDLAQTNFVERTYTKGLTECKPIVPHNMGK